MAAWRNTEPYQRVLSANPTGQLDRFQNRERNRPNRIAQIGGLGLRPIDQRVAGHDRAAPFKRNLKMNKLMTIPVAALALALVAFTPDLASAGHGHGGGWHGGGHWHGGGGWHRGPVGWHGGYRGWRGPRYAYRGWGYRGWRGYGWGWGGWWGPGINIYVGGYGRRCWSPAYGYYPCRYRYGYWGY
jgi:hypothetical protein